MCAYGLLILTAGTGFHLAKISTLFREHPMFSLRVRCARARTYAVLKCREDEFMPILFLVALEYTELIVSRGHR